MVENPHKMLNKQLSRQRLLLKMEARVQIGPTSMLEEEEQEPQDKKADHLNQDQIAEIQEVFSLFDQDGDGCISGKEVGAVLRSIGFNPSEAEILKLLDDFETDQNGTVDFSDFLGIMTRVERSGDTEDEVEEAFRVFDKEGNGIISAAELRLIMTNMGEKLTEEQVDEMLQYADGEAQGEINYKDFIKSLLAD